MITMQELENGSVVVHKNTGLRYSVVDVSDSEVLLSPSSDDMQDLMVAIDLFREEFVEIDRYSTGRGRGRGRARGRRAPAHNVPTGPKVRGKVKKLVPDRGFGFVRGEDGKVVSWLGGLSAHTSLTRREGWTIETLKPGDEITVTGAPARRGAPSVWVQQVILNGELLLSGESTG